MNNNTNEQFWILKDRETVKYGIFKIPIATLLLICSTLMLVLFVLTWIVERTVLPKLIGFDLPTVIKVGSLLSTLVLFTFLINSTGVIYFVVISSLIYFITHSMLVSGLIKYYLMFVDFTTPLTQMLYHRRDVSMFVLLLALISMRLVLVLPFCYYSLVLYLMRKYGGNGWNKVPAYELEFQNIPVEIEKLEKRNEYIKRKYGLESPT